MGPAEASVVRVGLLLVAELDEVLALEKEVDVGEVDALLPNLQLPHVVHVVFEVLLGRADSIAVAVTGRLERLGRPHQTRESSNDAR